MRLEYCFLSTTIALILSGCISTSPPPSSDKAFVPNKYIPPWAYEPERNALRVIAIGHVASSGSGSAEHMTKNFIHDMARVANTGNLAIDMTTKLSAIVVAPIAGAIASKTTKSIVNGDVYEIRFAPVTQIRAGFISMADNHKLYTKFLAAEGDYIPKPGDYIVLREAPTERRTIGVTKYPVSIDEAIDAEVAHKPSLIYAKADQARLSLARVEK